MDAKPTIFEFISFNFDHQNKRALFSYRQNFENREPLNFTETIIMPKAPDISHIPQELLERILQCLHLILGVSYYKLYCATNIKHNYNISKQEADFWNIIYKNGLGEFYFRNKLDPRKSPKFSYDKNKKNNPFQLEETGKYLVALSGGKDSIVAGELLREQGIDITAFFVETNGGSEIVDNVAEKMGVNLVKIIRILDKQVFEKYPYDGHIPVSAVYAFLGIFYAILYKYSFFVVANELSSNFGNIKYKGFEINHQWSKSSEFENIFSEYVNNFISPDIKYFSLLRPFYEIRIARFFSNYKKYFPYFSSCNKNFTLAGKKNGGLWCGECPKCAFAFNLFSAFLTKEELLGIFKKNLFEDKNLLPLFRDILGIGKIKPFDCVGTFEESSEAFLKGSKKFKASFIVKELIAKVKIKKKKSEELFRAHSAFNIPGNLKFSGMKNVLILGYGKEGEISKKYIKKYYPNLKISIADGKTGKNYLKKQKDFDIAIKSPGIRKELVEIPYTTATNIFFSEIKKLGNKIIAVTGSKGKSTTTSLIYAMLKEGGKNAQILGNIGKPMLEVLLRENPPVSGEIFVLELSSYQLDDIQFAPDIAVVTNLFPEHMNYHGGLKNYYEAKKNIINLQNKGDIFVYNPENKVMCDWAGKSKSRLVPADDGKFLETVNVPLLGEHNRKNINLAIAVARELNIDNESIKKAIENFKPLSHRLEFVGEFKNIKFYDDAISTTPDSTIMAINSIDNIDTIFLGGEDRGYDFSKLEKLIEKKKINNVVLFPDSGKKIKLKGKNILKTKSMEVAVKFAYKNTKQGSVCLLSCASPSYSVWKNFEEKGDEFKKFVKKLENEKTV